MNLLSKKSCTSTEFDLKLLELVKNRPLLWDTRQMDYKSSEKKMLEWHLIAEELDSEASECFIHGVSTKLAYSMVLLMF